MILKQAFAKRAALQFSLKRFDRALNSMVPSRASNGLNGPFSRTRFRDSILCSKTLDRRKECCFSAATQPSANSSKGSMRPAPNRRQKRQRRKQKQHDTADDHERHQLPTRKWPAAASAMIIPFVFAAYGVSDWMFGNRTRGHNEGLRQEFLEEQLGRYRRDGSGEGYLSSLETKPTLFHCVIRKNQGLVHCLPGVQLGDVVEILEERVGPEKSYNLCRLPAKPATQNQSEDDERLSISRDTYGWFPIRWLQKLDHYESMVQKQRTNNLSTADRQ